MHNLQYGTATPWRISANTMSNSDAASARTGSVGIELDSLAVSATITDNIVNGYDTGYYSWNTTAEGVVVDGGSVNGASMGVVASNYDPSWGNAGTSSLTLSDVRIAATTVGVKLVDHASNTNNARTTVRLVDTTSIVGGVTGIAIEGADVTLDATAGTALNGQSGTRIAIQNHTNTVDATNITFDGVTGSTATMSQLYAIEDTITHKTDDAALGLVRVNAGNIYVTTQSGSIQRGVGAASVGDRVNVGPGTYAETITVSKAVELRGPNYGINPNTGPRVTEAVIVPATTITDPASFGSI
ncbi:MAG: hypothetical protein ACK5S9_08440, partial [Roseiflexaceae bacterium]